MQTALFSSHYSEEIPIVIDGDLGHFFIPSVAAANAPVRPGVCTRASMCCSVSRGGEGAGAGVRVLGAAGRGHSTKPLWGGLQSQLLQGKSSPVPKG